MMMMLSAAEQPERWMARRFWRGGEILVTAPIIKKNALPMQPHRTLPNHARTAAAAALEGPRDSSVGVCAACGRRASGHSPTAASDGLEIF